MVMTMNERDFTGVLTPEGIRPVAYTSDSEPGSRGVRWCAHARVGGRIMRGTGASKVEAWTALATKILDRVVECGKEKAPGSGEDATRG